MFLYRRSALPTLIGLATAATIVLVVLALR